MSDELFVALDQHDDEAVVASLSRGADPNVRQAEFPRWRPIDAALEELDAGGSIEAVRLLIRYGADVNAWDEDHMLAPLHRAVFHHSMEAARLLLEAGADPNAVTGEGDSALRLAVEQGNVEMAALVLRHGGNEAIDANGGFCGSTVLGLAALKLDLPMMELLLDAGADPEALDEDDQTARERLPSRERASAQKWDAAMELLVRQRL